MVAKITSAITIHEKSHIFDVFLSEAAAIRWAGTENRKNEAVLT